MRRGWSVAVATVFVLSACGDDASSSTTTSSAAADATVAAATSLDGAVVDDEPGLQEGPRPPMVVTLLDSGAEPRQQLRLAPEVGTVVRSTLHVDSKSVMTFAGGELPVVAVVEFDTEHEVLAVVAGEFEVMVTIDEVRVVDADPTTRADFAEARDDIVGSSSIVRSDARGRIVDVVQFDAPELSGTDGGVNVRGLLEMPALLAGALPEEPVGLGASWSATRTELDAAGFEFTSTWTYTLDELIGSEVAATVTSSSSTPGDGAERVAGMIEQTGVVNWNLTAPTVIALDTSGEGRFTGSSDGQDVVLEQAIHTVLVAR